MKMVHVPVPRALLIAAGIGLAVMVAQEIPPMMRELKIIRM